jgi:hypothetical protein
LYGTYLGGLQHCPTIAHHILLDHHGCLILLFLRVVGEGSVCSIAIVGLLVGCQGIKYTCMEVFLKKPLLLQKKPTDRDRQGMLKVIQHALKVAKL